MSTESHEQAIRVALDRAARDAKSQSSEKRSGKLDVGSGAVAIRLRDEMRIATLNWATVEAFNNHFESFRDELHERGAWQPPMFAMRAVVRDVIMALMRLTEPAGAKGERQTLLVLAADLFARDPKHLCEEFGTTEHEVEASLDLLRQHLPADGNWPKASDSYQLSTLRTTFRPIRNSLIAHAAIYSSLDLRNDVPKVREFLQVVSMLTDQLCKVCNVETDDPSELWDAALGEAEMFWGIVRNGAARSTENGGLHND